ncbi:MAG: GxxExxY protein [Bacteroidota bacterium]
MTKTRTELNAISKSVLNTAFKVHSTYGPGLLESAYEAILVHELRKKGHLVKRQPPMPLVHEGVVLDTAYRLDILVDDEVIIELKSVEAISKVHHKQLITYLKLSDKRLGLLINFNVVSLKDGIHRKVNRF